MTVKEMSKVVRQYFGDENYDTVSFGTNEMGPYIFLEKFAKKMTYILWWDEIKTEDGLLEECSRVEEDFNDR